MSQPELSSNASQHPSQRAGRKLNHLAVPIYKVFFGSWSQISVFDDFNVGCGALLVYDCFQAAANDSVLQEFANLLSSQLGILEWCKNNNP